MQLKMMSLSNWEIDLSTSKSNNQDYSFIDSTSNAQYLLSALLEFLTMLNINNYGLIVYLAVAMAAYIFDM